MSEYKYYLKKIYQSASGTVILELGDSTGRPVFDFKPGQYVMLSYKNSLGKYVDKHAFSIASSPTQKSFLGFGIKVQGIFTQGLLSLKEGDEIIISGPHGDFFYDEKKYRDIVMIAGGIGITPFFSALNYATDLNLDNKLSLIYSCRTSQEATFYNGIKALAKKNKNISTLFSFTDESGDMGDKMVIHKRIDADIIKDFIGSINGKTFFICGPSLFMRAMVDNLLALGVEKKQIKMEEFTMIPDKTLWSRLRGITYATGFALVLFGITYGLVSRPVIVANKNNYDPLLINKVNQAAYDRMISIYAAKNKALVDLNKQILAARTSPAINNITSAPVYPSITTQSAPITRPISAPTPRTRVS